MCLNHSELKHIPHISWYFFSIAFFKPEDRKGSRKRENKVSTSLLVECYYCVEPAYNCLHKIYTYIYIYTYKHIYIYINNGVLGVHDPLRISYLKPDYKITLRNIMSKPQDKMFKKDDTAYCTITEVLIWIILTKNAYLQETGRLYLSVCTFLYVHFPSEKMHIYNQDILAKMKWFAYAKIITKCMIKSEKWKHISVLWVHYSCIEAQIFNYATLQL